MYLLIYLKFVRPEMSFHYLKLSLCQMPVLFCIIIHFQVKFLLFFCCVHTNMHNISPSTCPNMFLFQPQKFLERYACLCFKYCVQYISICLKPYIKAVAFKVTGMFRQELAQFTPSLNSDTFKFIVYKGKHKIKLTSDVLKGYEIYF